MQKQKTVYTGITALLVSLFAFLGGSSEATDQAPADCKRVAVADRALCQKVYRQRAYGWTDPKGNPKSWVPSGRKVVHDLTHQGYSKEMMHKGLVAEHGSYRRWVSAVSFNVDAIKAICGNTDGLGLVSVIDEDGKPGGRKYTWKRVDCA